MSFNIKENIKKSLPIHSARLKAPTNHKEAQALRVIGLDYSFTNGHPDYEIFNWSYYDALKKNHYEPSLSNMIALHNQLFSERNN